MLRDFGEGTVALVIDGPNVWPVDKTQLWDQQAHVPPNLALSVYAMPDRRVRVSLRNPSGKSSELITCPLSFSGSGSFVLAVGWSEAGMSVAIAGEIAASNEPAAVKRDQLSVQLADLEGKRPPDVGASPSIDEAIGHGGTKY